jgi:8-amino-7-oxononanoate synthase
MLFDELQLQLDERRAQGLLRFRHTVTGMQTPHLFVDEKPYLSFCSNDYLGLASHPQLIHALQLGAAQYGTGAGAAHLVNGHFDVHQQLEEQLADFAGKPASLLFSAGYMANLGVIGALTGRHDTIFADKLNHASLNDAIRLSGAKMVRFRHNDMAQLALMLCKPKQGRKLICTDAVFSMDGDRAHLPELLTLCETHDAWLLVDDAHGFGVTGHNGRGSLSHFGIDSPRIIYMATLGKAAGIFGAFVAAEQVVIDTLINYAHSYVYTTASPPALSFALLQSLRLIVEGDERRAHLQNLIAQLRRGLVNLPWQLMPSDTAIQPLLVGSNWSADALSRGLRERGIWVAAIRPPTVPVGTARLRLTLSASHSALDVEQLSSALHELAHG